MLIREKPHSSPRDVASVSTGSDARRPAAPRAAAGFLSHCFEAGAGVAVLLVLGAAGCGGAGGLTAGLAAPPLPEFDESNVYDPYYVSGEMASPRYFHKVLRLATGLVLAAGGSDENGFSTLDTAEIFDQATVKRDETAPESKTGTWFDTDFEGDPIVMSAGRLLFTMTELSDNRVIIIGGAANMNLARPIGQAEIFDPLTRTFEIVEEEMVEPRFRHTATTAKDGRIIIAGGQIHSVFTETQDLVVVGGGQQGGTSVQIQRDIFPSTRRCEFYSVIENAFFTLTLPESSREALLTPSRGRAGHVVAPFAGPDNRLNTGDDLFLLVGGFQTLSGENAPQAKFPGNSRGGGIQQLEFWDPVVGIFTEVPVVRLLAPRVNDPQATNLGLHNETTIDGVLGMGNVILVTHGDNDSPSGGRTSVMLSELYIATFTGFGPAQGLQLFRQDSPYDEHSQGREAFTALGDIAYEFDPCGPPGPGRTTSNIVPLPRRIATVGGSNITTWVYAGVGAHLAICPPGVQTVFSTGTVAAGCLFDPFYSLTAIFDFDSSARDLRPGRRNQGNPIGVIGTWLVLDGIIPTTTLEGFGDSAYGNYPSPNSVHFWTQLINVAGADGIDNTIDDRVLIVGGGRDIFAPGGEPSFPSTELLITPGTGSDAGN
jgi:hypothetical protein